MGSRLRFGPVSSTRFGSAMYKEARTKFRFLQPFRSQQQCHQTPHRVHIAGQASLDKTRLASELNCAAAELLLGRFKPDLHMVLNFI